MPGAEPLSQIAPEWTLQRRLWGHSFHPMCSYLGSFPASLAHAFIGRYSRPGDIVLDPFSGRGTTPLQACAEGRIGVGNDLHPLAALLTAAKLDPPARWDALARLQLLRIDWSRRADEWLERAIGFDAPPLVASLFHPRTLAQLLFLRQGLDTASRTDRFLMASLAGILHGRSDGYLTPLLPNTFSPPPGYVATFVGRSRARPPERDVFSRLERKLVRLYRQPPPQARGIGLGGDARTAGSRARIELRRRALPDRARLVVTSPPYLRVLRYDQHNWLRSWLVGDSGMSHPGNNSVAGAATDDQLRPPEYAVFMRAVLADLRHALATDAVVVLVLGDVARDRGRSRGTIAGLADLVWHEAAEPEGYELAGCLTDPVQERRKMTGLWGPERGRATTVDRLLVIAPTEAGRRRALADAGRPVDWAWPPPSTRSPSWGASAGARALGILARDAPALSPPRPRGDGPVGPDEESRPRADDQPPAQLRAAAAGSPVHPRG